MDLCAYTLLYIENSKMDVRASLSRRTSMSLRTYVHELMHVRELLSPRLCFNQKILGKGNTPIAEDFCLYNLISAVTLCYLFLDNLLGLAVSCLDDIDIS